MNANRLYVGSYLVIFEKSLSKRNCGVCVYCQRHYYDSEPCPDCGRKTIPAIIEMHPRIDQAYIESIDRTLIHLDVLDRDVVVIGDHLNGTIHKIDGISLPIYELYENIKRETRSLSDFQIEINNIYDRSEIRFGVVPFRAPEE